MIIGYFLAYHSILIPVWRGGGIHSQFCWWNIQVSWSLWVLASMQMTGSCFGGRTKGRNWEVGLGPSEGLRRVLVASCCCWCCRMHLILAKRQERCKDQGRLYAHQSQQQFNGAMSRGYLWIVCPYSNPVDLVCPALLCLVWEQFSALSVL